MIDRSHLRHEQRGVALPMGLVILVVMMLIGVAAIQSTTLDEKMAGNETDRNRAFQAAEAALRDAERDFTSGGRDLSGLSAFSPDCGASTTASDADDGLCYNGPAGYATPIWTTASMTGAPSVQYGRFTGAAGISGVSAQPRYLIQGLRQNVPGSGTVFYYRITARAQGASPNTVVWLQTVFKP